jgi:hypothetical protein
MRTIYLVRKVNRYSAHPTNIRCFEVMADAEDLVGVLKLAGSEDVEVVPLELSPSTVPRLRDIDITPRAALP